VEDELQGLFIYFERHWGLGQGAVMRILHPNT
jgi:hypothetical protein